MNRVKLGELIQQFSNKNKDGEDLELLGVAITKNFMPSVANVIDTDLTNYKVISMDEFACNSMHIGRDKVLPVAIYKKETSALVSPAFTTFKVKDKDLLLPDYLYYILTSPVVDKFLCFKSDASVRGSSNWDDLCSIEINLPTIEKQKRIIKSIELINQGIERKQQISKKIYQILVNEFTNYIDKYSELTVKLDDCVKKINTGADAIQKAPIVDYDTGFRCIRIGDITNNRYYLDWGFTEINQKNYDNYKLDKNDIVITRTAVNGLSYLITDEKNVVCNNGNIRLKVNEKYNPLFIYLYTKTKDFKDYINRINEATSVRPNMKVEYLINYDIKYIDIEKQNAFCEKYNSFFNKIKSIEKEIYYLQKYKIKMLNNITSGNINV